WSYDRQKGIRMFTNSKGELVRQTLIMGSGPARLKLRKQEVLRNDEWVATVQNFYDSKGRVIRTIEGASNVLWIREEKDGIFHREKWINNILSETVKMRGNQFLEKKRY